MTGIKAVFCMWVGVFLLLPNCICQVLAPFGIILHPAEFASASSASKRTPVEVGPPNQVVDRQFHCCCGEETSKTAEEDLAENEYVSEGFGPAVFAAMPWGDFEFQKYLGERMVLSRPPPGLVPAWSFVWTGSFRC